MFEIKQIHNEILKRLRKAHAVLRVVNEIYSTIR